MLITDDRDFPAALAALATTEIPYADEGGIDFEPYPGFLTAENTTDWFRAWTGNPDVTGDAFRVFGQDGTGGYGAFWLVRPGAALTGQPVVFLGSEGELAVVAPDLAGLLWLLADGYGPCEAALASGGEWPARPDAALTAIAERFAPGRRRPPAETLTAAAAEFPGFEAGIDALCR